MVMSFCIYRGCIIRLMLTRTIIKFAAPLPKIENYNRYLFIGPHPDDIEIGAGATVAKLIDKGKDVYYLICTDGRYGNGHMLDKSYDEVASVRKQETINCAKYLGVKEDHIYFLGLSDGGFYDINDLEKGIARIVGIVKPDVIFAPDPDVISETHKDHLNVGKCAKYIANFAPYEGIMKNYGTECANVEAIALYMSAKVNQFVKTSGYFKKQVEAVKKYHVSQFQNKEFDSIELYLKLRSIEFGIRSLKGCAEGFRVLGKTQMHCLPESGG